MSKRNFQVYSKNERLRNIMIAAEVNNLVELAEELGLAYATVSNWNRRNRITKPELIIERFPQLNPNYVISGTLPIFQEKAQIALSNKIHSADIIKDIMVNIDIKNRKEFAKALHVPESYVNNWIKTNELPDRYYRQLKKVFPYYFTMLEKSDIENRIAEDTALYEKKESLTTSEETIRILAELNLNLKKEIDMLKTEIITLKKPTNAKKKK